MWKKKGDKHTYHDDVTGLAHPQIRVIGSDGYFYYTVPGVDGVDSAYRGEFDLDLAKLRSLKAWLAEENSD